MTDQLTPWFDPKVDGQPVRVGMWQRQLPFGIVYRCFWNGERWFVENEDGELFLSAVQELPWRGLTEPNEEKQ